MFFILIILICLVAFKSGFIEIDLSRSNDSENITLQKPQATPIYTPNPIATPTFAPKIIQTPQYTKSPETSRVALPSLNGSNIFYFINDYRLKNGVPQIPLNDELCQYAQKRAETIASEDPQLKKSALMNHFKFREFINSLNEDIIIGENINVNSTTESQVLEGWKSSPPHNELMLATHFPEGAIYFGGCVKSVVTSQGNNATVFLVGGK